MRVDSRLAFPGSDEVDLGGAKKVVSSILVLGEIAFGSDVEDSWGKVKDSSGIQ